MTYIDLGKHLFTTTPDQSGFNAGNMTSVLDTSTVNVPYFEVYRMMFNIASIPAALPAVQQVASNQGTSATTLNINFAGNTVKNNLIVVSVGTVSGTGTNPAVSAVTLGAAADHFGSVNSVGGGADIFSTYMWANPDCQETSKNVVVTMTGGTGADFQVLGYAYEIANTLLTTSATACADITETGTSGGATVASQQTSPIATTTHSSEIQVGFGVAGVLGTHTLALSATGAGWNSAPEISAVSGAGNTLAALASSMVTASNGVPSSYGLASTPAAIMNVILASFFPKAGSGAPAAASFAVVIDGSVWDAQETTAGSAYTYDLHQPMYLNTGQSIQVLWALPAAQYGAFGQYFNCQAWLRYDPDRQPGTLQ